MKYKNNDEKQILRDSEGNPIRTADGSPIYHDQFENDISDTAFMRENSKSEQEFLEETSEANLDLEDEDMKALGLVKDENGKWVFPKSR